MKTAQQNRLRTHRTVTEMVALDTINELAARVTQLLSHGRRVAMTCQSTYSDDTRGYLDVRAGLELACPVEIVERHGVVNVSVRLGRGLLDGFGFSADPTNSPTAADVWRRYHQGQADRYSMTQIEINGGMAGDGPCTEDRLTVRRWTDNGRLEERTIVFDAGTGPCTLVPLRERLDLFWANLTDQQPWDVRKMLQDLRDGLHEHLAHHAGDVGALMNMIRSYGDSREAIAGAQAVAGPQEEDHHRGQAWRELASIDRLLRGDRGDDEPARCVVCGGDEQVYPDEDGTNACKPCHATRLTDDDDPADFEDGGR